MTTEELVETFIQVGREALIKHTSKRCLEIRKLIRKEPVMIDGNEYNCLQELVVYKVAEEIRTILPECKIEVILDGNDSILNMTLTDEEREKLMSYMYVFLHKNKCL